MKTILHVSDNFGGGLVTAVQGYVTNTPQHKHYLLAAKKVGFHDQMAWATALAGQYELPKNKAKAPLALRKVYAEIKPDWVHLHSSFAGFYGRIAFLPRRKIIYTPHCYAVERRDINMVARAGYWLAEQFLALGNATVAAVSPREAELAQTMLMQQDVVLLPNVPVMPDSVFAHRAQHQRGVRLRVAMVGRLTAQKDPDFFIATVKLAKHRGLKLDFIWLGGGDEAWAKTMQELGVTVTGWLDHTTMMERLAECDIYFHTAAWESGPLSVLEAARLGLHMVCRSIPAIDSLPVRPSIKTPAEAADMFNRILNGNPPLELAKINHKLNKSYTVEAQQDALEYLYGDD